MKRYRLNPDKPRQLTPEEERRLRSTRIDYSDILPLGDEFFATATKGQAMLSATDERDALLLQIVLDDCAGDGVMRLLSEPADPDALCVADYRLLRVLLRPFAIGAI